MAKYRILVTAPYMLSVIDDYGDLFARHDAEMIKARIANLKRLIAKKKAREKPQPASRPSPPSSRR